MKKISFKINVDVSNKECPKHHVNLISYGNIPPFCPKCKQEEIDRQKEEEVKQFKYSSIHHYINHYSLFDRPDELGYSFQDFRGKNAMIQGYKSKAEEFAKEYAENPDKKFNTIFSGRAGTGKTHLAMAILNYVNQHSDQKCLFLSMSRLVRENRKWFQEPELSDWSQDYTAERVRNADLVVIDDLGAESAAGNATNFVQNVVFDVYESNQRIITTTNLNAAQIRATYDQRLLSRIEEHAEGHVLDFDRLPDERVKA